MATIPEDIEMILCNMTSTAEVPDPVAKTYFTHRQLVDKVGWERPVDLIQWCAMLVATSGYDWRAAVGESDGFIGLRANQVQAGTRVYDRTGRGGHVVRKPASGHKTCSVLWDDGEEGKKITLANLTAVEPDLAEV